MLYKKLQTLASTAAAASLLSATTAQAGNCSSRGIAPPVIPEGRVLGLSASPVRNYQTEDNSTLNFCNVTVTYTHPGKDDNIHVTVWLPLSGWSGRLQGSGGGGYAMRHDDSYLAEAVALKYSVVATDGGHEAVSSVSESWSLGADSNVNMALLEDFASIGLNDAALIGKQVTRSFYGHGPQFSYWNGCSTGGRQGLMLAQRYPTAYDGIMAAAPAINWPSFLVAEYWPQFIMNQLQTYPAKCVTDAITNATIKACDGLDGVTDGIISAPDLCRFNPLKLVNSTANCDGMPVKITRRDALVVQKTWEGLKSANGSSLWYGLNKGTPLSMGASSLAGTTCDTPLSNCSGSPFSISADWISRFVLQDPSIDLTQLDHHDLDTIFASSKARYNAIIGTDNPDLSAFKFTGGKMITWHGLADPLIFPKGTEHYYRQAEALDPALRDFYRFFPAPGVNHCRGGDGPIPVDPLSAVVEWVEQGVAPESIAAKASDGRRRNLCPWPLVSVYKGGDAMDAENYACEESF
ncbi:hypothetical protein N8T08_008938 [Aspergillus melleus]|uniref:Uncharacterized protein n=1 Tax=Aspergillus melleus TaxID=138277 RepID=A0ACC3AVF1_9EURO|nr:hypothetical protein N8T08_008938 [Aspergillus melleus]